MQHQDAAFEPSDTDSADSQGDSDWAVCIWQNYPEHAQALLSPEDLDAALTDGALSERHLAPPAQRWDRSVKPQRSGETAKRILDIIGAVLLALLLSPLLITVFLILVSEGGPVLYSHPRTGRHGRTFGCLKFRTMVPQAEQVLRELLQRDPDLRREWSRDQKLRNDPRITGIGALLRRTSLDELPQLWNVLRGEMSLVGPRPVVREEWQRYGRRLDWYLAAKPGVTGLWQIMGRNNTSYRRRVALDSYYVRKRTLLMDCFILIRTVKVVIQARGAS